MPDQYNDNMLFYRSQDMSAGQFSNQYPTDKLYMPENAGEELLDMDIDEVGKRKKRKGYDLIADDVGANAVNGLQGYYPPGGSKVLVMESNGTVYTWNGSAGSWSSSKTGLTATTLSELKVAKGLLFRLGQTDNIWSYDGSSWTDEGGSTVEGGGADPPKGKIGIWTSNQRFLVGNTSSNPNYIWPSDAGDPQTFGDAAFKFGSRDGDGVTGLAEFTDGEVMALTRKELYNWNITDTTSSNWTQKKIADVGCVAQRSVRQLGPDVLFLSQDGVRSILQSAQDKKRGESLPLSYPIQDWITRINWAYVQYAAATVWNDKYYLAVPIDDATVNSHVLVFSRRAFEANGGKGGWTVYTNYPVADWAVQDFSDTRKLYFGDAGDDTKVYMTRSDDPDDEVTNDNDTAIEFSETGKRLDFDSPFVDKLFNKLEVEVLQEDSGSLTVYAQIDGEGYNSLGTLDLSTDAPTLPVNLPFSLVGGKKARGEFFLEGLGRGRNIQIKLTQDTADVDVTILGYTITAYKENVEFE